MRNTKDEMTFREKVEQYGIQGVSNKDIIKSILLLKKKESSTLDKLVEKVMEEMDKPGASDFSRIRGIDEELAIVLNGIRELIKRKNGVTCKTVIQSPKDIFKRVRHYAFDNEQERLIVGLLNGAHEVIDVFVSTVGLVNRTLVHPREVFAPAIEQRAAALFIAHNHPTRNLEPSEDDKSVTERIRKAGDVLGIKLLDHLVFSEDGYFSFLEYGML